MVKAALLFAMAATAWLTLVHDRPAAPRSLRSRTVAPSDPRLADDRWQPRTRQGRFAFEGALRKERGETAMRGFWRLLLSSPDPANVAVSFIDHPEPQVQRHAMAETRVRFGLLPTPALKRLKWVEAHSVSEACREQAAGMQDEDRGRRAPADLGWWPRIDAPSYVRLPAPRYIAPR